MDGGFRCVVAPSFADIFYNNCFKNGLLPLVLSEAEVDRLFYDCAAFPGFRLVVDLATQSVSTADGSRTMRFEVDAFRKHCLLNGLDEIGLTLRQADKIRVFEARRKAQFPWYF
jgi:3-isopropylmalate/(R)-2-methylmalate dehydratase small subunit